jgi:hypothetical protein
VKNRLLWTALVLVCLSVSLTAQPLVVGQTYLLKSAKDRYLSAHHDPAQELGFSSNSAGWEQWRYMNVNGSYQFISYHGTALIVADGDAVFHGPPTRLEPSVLVEGVADSTNENAQPLGIYSATITNGRIIFPHKTPNRTSRELMVDTGKASPEMVAESTSRIMTTNSLYKAVSWPNQWWTAIPVASPDLNRLPPQESVVNGDPCNVKSYQGQYLRIGTYTGLSVNSFDTILSPTVPTSTWMIHLIQTNRNALNDPAPLTFGSVYIEMNTASQIGPAWLGPGITTNGMIAMPSVRSYGTQTAWTVIDSSGRYHAGDRIPIASKVTFRAANGKVIGGDSSSTMPLMIDSGPQALWTIVK